jgi:phosphonate transport system permease protein
MSGAASAALPDAAAIAAARARLPRAFGPTRAQRWHFWLGLAAGTALFAFALWWVGFSLARIWNGLGKLGWLLQFMLPPRHGGAFGELARALLETLAMAFVGTALAALVALPLGLIAARNVVGWAPAHFAVRRLLDVWRGIDVLIWALIFVSAVGLGPFAGVMAIAMSDIGTLAKLCAEAVENAEHEQVEGVRAAGAGRLAEIRFGLLPQMAPIMLSHVLYFFESNARSATILGVVGAGGIGLALSDRIRINNWDQACFIVLMILVAVAAIDGLSGWLRRRLAGAR